MVQINTQLLSILAGLVVPLLVGTLTHSKASSAVKAILNAGLSAVGGALATAIAHQGSVDWHLYLFNIGLTWALSIATYFGLWQPTGTAPALSSFTDRYSPIGRPAGGPQNPPPPAPSAQAGGV
jgi:hypothetical protein